MDSLYSILKFYIILLNFHSIHKYLSGTTTCHGKYSKTLYARLCVTKICPKFATGNE